MTEIEEAREVLARKEAPAEAGSSLAETMKRLDEESRHCELYAINAQLRKYLAGALCAACGDALGDDETITQDDQDKTMHASCDEVGKKHQRLLDEIANARRSD